MTEVAEARVLADRHLAGRLPRRWRHVQAVAAQAARVADRLDLRDGTLVAAAWLHDIGYGPDLVETGFHPLDGGRYLRRSGVGDRLARLVAHHSCAVYEARVRGFERELLAEFDREESPTSDALVYCDMTTGPGGEVVGFLERMDEIEQRYGPGHEVTEALQLSRPDLTLCCRRTLERLEGLGGLPDVGFAPVFQVVADPRPDRRVNLIVRKLGWGDEADCGGLPAGSGHAT